MLIDAVYDKLSDLSKQVKQSLFRKGLVVPSRNTNGSISVGRYTIIRQPDNSYCILNQYQDIVVDQINLPQTAAVLANDLALGKILNQDLVQKDLYYGYFLFDEAVLKNVMKKTDSKDIKSHDILVTKYRESKIKRAAYRRYIFDSFEKLKKIA